jgi:hypothetical protein
MHVTYKMNSSLIRVYSSTVVDLLRSRLSFFGIQVLALAALVVATRSNPVLGKPEWFAPCGTQDNRTLESRLVYRNWVISILSHVGG